MRMRTLALLTLVLCVTSFVFNGCQQKVKEETPPPADQTAQTPPAGGNSADIYARAEAAHMAGQYDEAAALLRDFPAGTPETALAHNLLGLTYAKLGNAGLAEVEFQSALAADPNLKNANYNLAVLRLSDGRLDQAEAGFKAAIKTDPYFAPAHQGLAEVYRRTNRAADAKAEDKIATELAAKAPPAGNTIADLDLGKSLTVGNMAEAPKAGAKPKAAAAPKPKAPPAPTTVEVQLSAPAGTQFNVAIGSALSSANATVGQEVTGTVSSAVMDGNETIIHAGAPVKGRVTAAKSSGRVKGRAELSVAFTSVETVAGWRDIDAPLANGTIQAQGTKKQDAAKIGIGAAAGAVIGEVVGGSAAKGAVIGGAAGTGLVLATKGKEVEIAAGSEIPVALAAPLAISITKTVAPK
jgi:Tfp pilus assembly protein PilF